LPMVMGLRFLFWVEGQSCGRARSGQSRLCLVFQQRWASSFACCPVWSTGFLWSNGAGVVQRGSIGRVGRLVCLSLVASGLSRLLVRL
jgi:hypothetical protein